MELAQAWMYVITLDPWFKAPRLVCFTVQWWRCSSLAFIRIYIEDYETFLFLFIYFSYIPRLPVYDKRFCNPARGNLCCLPHTGNVDGVGCDLSLSLKYKQRKRTIMRRMFASFFFLSLDWWVRFHTFFNMCKNWIIMHTTFTNYSARRNVSYFTDTRNRLKEAVLAPPQSSTARKSLTRLLRPSPDSLTICSSTTTALHLALVFSSRKKHTFKWLWMPLNKYFLSLGKFYWRKVLSRLNRFKIYQIIYAEFS